ncbi:MAG: iron-sulfur cluster assembly accessory protein [Lentisphaeraceae bacterium]|nr:iron-sulfur cluster assembly accessory protein [Lentisphaeraceae bacterium]
MSNRSDLLPAELLHELEKLQKSVAAFPASEAHRIPEAELGKDSDELFEQHGIKIIIDPKSMLYLGGVTVDFKDDLMGRGFVFNNPSASSSCGCGSSFAV